MFRLIALAAIVWPVVLGGALWARVSPSAAAPAYSAIVYLAGSRICHQKPARTFHTAGVPWPVCARCSGLYISAPIGAVLAWGAWRGGRVGRRRVAMSPLRLVGAAAVPALLTLLWEWGTGSVPSNAIRAASAVPLGAAIAFVIVLAAAGRPRSIG